MAKIVRMYFICKSLNDRILLKMHIMKYEFVCNFTFKSTSHDCLY